MSPSDFLPIHLLQVSFGHCRPLAASQVTRRKDMEVLHKFAQLWITHMRFFWCLLDPPKTCSFAGLIKLCRILTGLFWDVVYSFAGLFHEMYYIFKGESSSKADKFDNLRRMKIQNMPLTQKRPVIRTKRHDKEQTPQTKKRAIRTAFFLSFFLSWVSKTRPITFFFLI